MLMAWDAAAVDAAGGEPYPHSGTGIIAAAPGSFRIRKQICSPEAFALALGRATKSLLDLQQ